MLTYMFRALGHIWPAQVSLFQPALHVSKISRFSRHNLIQFSCHCPIPSCLLHFGESNKLVNYLQICG